MWEGSVGKCGRNVRGCVRGCGYGRGVWEENVGGCVRVWDGVGGGVGGECAWEGSVGGECGRKAQEGV